jgi:hypothetical protein
VPTGPSQTVIEQNQVISTSGGGTTPRVVDYSGLDALLGGISFASVQRELTIKRFFAFNRNALARAGQQFVDSDGDGLSDEEEKSIGTDPSIRTPMATAWGRLERGWIRLDTSPASSSATSSSTTTPICSTSARSGSAAPTLRGRHRR